MSATPFKDHVEARKPGDRFRVFPIVEGGKTPACPNGFKDATDDPIKLAAWAKENPAYNVGHCPDDSGHFVLDVDPRHGGDKSLEKLIAEHGPLPVTYKVRTPSGGYHYWFKGTAPSSAGRLGEGLDIRGRGGYVLVEGSRVNGVDYVAVD